MDADRWKVSVDQRKCVSSGLCQALAGQWFEVTPRGSRPVADEVDPDDDVIEAAEVCPVGAIAVVKASDGALIAP